MDIREYCTCPGCLTVWAHPETRDWWADWQWAQTRYGPPTTCPECGLITAALPRQSFWREFAHGEYRYLVERPREEEPEPGDAWPSCSPTPSARSSDTAPATVTRDDMGATAVPQEKEQATARQDVIVRRARRDQRIVLVVVGLFILLTILLQLSR